MEKVDTNYQPISPNDNTVRVLRASTPTFRQMAESGSKAQSLSKASSGLIEEQGTDEERTV